jgi:threonylcarbamoyladenosine tRNA methylthiotransferase MtaB
MNSLRAAFHTLGCKTNHYETDAMRRQFSDAGCSIVPFDTQADIYLVNTCAVTAEADRKSSQMLRRARQLNPNALIVAVGCQVVLGGSAAWADLTIDNKNKSQAYNLTQSAFTARMKQSGRLSSVEQTGDQAETGYDELGLVDQQSETRAYVKIEDGCNNRCAYCAIPLARGPVRSRQRQNIIDETKALVSAGYREIVLTGIHLCSYGADWGQPSHAVMQLALELAAIPGLSRIRLGSLEPLSLTPAFLDLAEQNPKLCPHFHLSLQSGSDRTLTRMNRRYLTGDYRSVIGELRRRFDHPGITTDVMVGFPGESDEDFCASLDFCREIAFARMHVFRYSVRRRTAAAVLAGRIAPAVMAERSRQMLSLANQLFHDNLMAHIGSRQQVLLEKRRPDGSWEGTSASYIPVRVTGGGLAAGQIMTVRGLAVEDEFLRCAQT